MIPNIWHSGKGKTIKIVKRWVTNRNAWGQKERWTGGTQGGYLEIVPHDSVMMDICHYMFVKSQSVNSNVKYGGAWVAQSVKQQTSTQFMISRFVGWSSILGCVLTAQSLESASGSVYPSLSAPLPLTVSLCLSTNE